MQLLAVHTLTGCDTVNFPYDKGKSSAVSTLLNHQTELDMMGEEEAKMLSVIAKAHKFMLLFYKENRPLCFINEYRYLMFSKNKDSNIIETLPAIDPASKHKMGTLTDHALEISWSNTNLVVSLKDLGWHVEADGVPKPSHGNNAVAPPELMEVIACSCCSVLPCSHNSCSCRCARLSCTTFCKCSAGDECNNLYTAKSTDDEDMVIVTAAAEATL